MLISKLEIIKKIAEIPPLPQSVKDTIHYLKIGELQKAADSADSDIVLKQRISKIVNSAYFGFSEKVTNTRQMFSIMGLEMARGVLLSYMVTLLMPKEWKLFKDLDFEEFQSAFLNYSKDAIILELDEVTYKKYSDSIAIIPATICLVDDLLGEKFEQVQLLRESGGLDYGKILKRFTGMTLFELASIVAKKWELDKENVELVKLVECSSCFIKDRVKKIVGATLHLEFFYLVSKPQFFELNSFIEFNPEVLKIAIKNYERKLNEE